MVQTSSAFLIAVIALSATTSLAAPFNPKGLQARSGELAIRRTEMAKPKHRKGERKPPKEPGTGRGWNPHRKSKSKSRREGVEVYERGYSLDELE